MELDDLIATVARESGAKVSALTLIHGIAQAVRNLSAGEVSARAAKAGATQLADDLDAKAGALAKAVAR